MRVFTQRALCVFLLHTDQAESNVVASVVYAGGLGWFEPGSPEIFLTNHMTG